MLFRSGLLKRTSLRETPLCLVLESKTTCICPGFCGSQTPKMGKCQNSWPGFSGGAVSAWSASHIFCMKQLQCSGISGLCCKVLQRDIRCFITYSRLFRRRQLSDLKGKNATQLFKSSMKTSWSIVCKKLPTSTDMAGLSSCCAIPLTCEDLLREAAVSNLSLTWILLGQELKNNAQPLLSTLVL